MDANLTRRVFMGTAAATTAVRAGTDEKLAVLGGPKVRKTPFPSWPVIGSNDEQAWMEVLRKGRWNRTSGNQVQQFEERWAQTIGAKHCVATANGTAALIVALNALGIGPGDEVIVPPYTFVATINAVLLQHAMPIFVDSDPETFQIDARKIEAAITKRTACILPVHLGGASADMDVILDVAKKHKLPVLEDACQAHLAEWKGRKVSSLGDIGCFSFQASKNLNSGEGGAVLTNNDDLIHRSRGFHNNGNVPDYNGSGCNLRMTEFQGALLMEQLTRLEAQSQIRERNAKHLTSQLKEIQGITPARQYEGCTRNAYHLYMFRYNRERFNNVPKASFLKALAAEGIPCYGGYTPLNKAASLTNTLNGKAYRYIYPAKELADYQERNHCPKNDRLCEEGVWIPQTALLGDTESMDHIAQAILKVQKQSTSLLA
jgi:dTDP-4-amino-4,6-dideoxygalactose transaminase